ncbi:predicted protein [Micromonas commoda]|uniref:Uncharacterized protein n=1 Tax=Micromonas commoda (strain RCC299 / NOUM17 / CCMP2709) TaxID=296587 RepID=C1DZ68_MICCC|nr:predicted protein [Micromonas commoda]ACO61556.1 predicted protein [Micromonas commoda]|eukprot:XP_002500298.1 predicted protein [Micromonas commoda]
MERVRTLSAPEGTGSILCCALSPHGSRTALALGGEEAAACVVDLRVAGGDATSSTSAVAHSLRAGLGCFHADDAVASVTWHPTREHVLLCAHGRVVTAWDVRHLPSETAGSADSAAAAVAGMSLAGTRTVDADAGAAPRGRVHLYAFNNDEVNSVCVDRKGRRMCAADDGGEIVVVDIGDETSVAGALVKTLKNGHENIASGAVFRDHKPHDVVSGGLDCAVCKWDQSRSTPVATWRVGELASASDAESGAVGGGDDDDAAASPPPMCNPPMVHAIACANGFEVSDDCAGVKRLVAAACGDGTCALIDLDLSAGKSGAGKSRNNKPGSRTSKGRSSSSSSSSAAAGGEAGGTLGGSGSEPGDPFASRGGRERRAAVFLGRSFGGGGGRFEAGHSGSCNSVAFAGWSGGRLVLTGGNDRHVGVWDWRECGGGGGAGGVGGGGGGGARVRFFRHGRKVNWVCAAGALDNPGGFGDTFVADTGEKVAAYALSL